jgi:hypothetical protein
MANEMAFLYGTPAGVAGSISRPLDSFVEPIQLGATPPTAFGSVLVMEGGNTGKFVAITGSNTATDIKGFLVRTAPRVAPTVDGSFAENAPNPAYFQGRLIRGYIKVACTQGTPVKGAPVYVRIVAATGKNIGDIEAVADGSNNLAILWAEWATNGKDGNNIAEINYSI